MSGLLATSGSISRVVARGSQGMAEQEGPAVGVGAPEVVKGGSDTQRDAPDLASWFRGLQSPTHTDTIILEPKGKHQVTVVFLHGLSDSGARVAEDMKDEGFPDCIKWIFPTAPLSDVEIADVPLTAWFNATPLDDGMVDLDRLDKTAEMVANLLADDITEDGEKKVKLVIGGFSQGAAATLYLASRSVIGKLSNGTPFPIKFDAAICLSGWLPTHRTHVAHVNECNEGEKRAGELPIFIGHCKDDPVVPFKHAEKSSGTLCSAGSTDLSFKSYPVGQHSSAPQMLDVKEWLITKLG